MLFSNDASLGMMEVTALQTCIIKPAKTFQSHHESYLRRDLITCIKYLAN
ncbi:hypothetical protein [Rubritalea marina]|nr:hypothetical protein [Rubritalea marina]